MILKARLSIFFSYEVVAKQLYDLLVRQSCQVYMKSVATSNQMFDLTVFGPIRPINIRTVNIVLKMNLSLVWITFLATFLTKTDSQCSYLVIDFWIWHFSVLKLVFLLSYIHPKYGNMENNKSNNAHRVFHTFG